MNVFDAGSDLSEIESNASPPATPGNAITPQTSPTHRARPLSPSFAIASSSSGRKVAGPSNYNSITDKKVKRKMAGPENLADEERKLKKKRSKMEKPKSGIERAGKDIKSPQGVDVEQEPDLTSQPTASSMIPAAIVHKTKAVRKNPKGWAYVPEEEFRKPEEDIITDGRRTRRPTTLYTAAPSTKRSRDSASVDASSSAPAQSNVQAAESNEVVPKGTRKPKITIRVNMDSKPRSEIVPESSVKNNAEPSPDDASAESEMSDPPVLEDAEDEYEEDVIAPPRKRQKDAKRISRHEDDEEDEDIGPKRLKVKGAKPGRKSKMEKRERKHQKKMARVLSEEDSGDEFKDAKISEDEVMSDAADEEGFESDVKTGSRTEAKLAKAKAREDVAQGSNGISSLAKKSETRKSTGSAASTKTVAGLINAYTKPAPAPISTKPAIVKAAVRKVPSMNLFDNIMGFGGGSKQSTPAKGVHVKAARSSLSGVNTPQNNSPLVKGSSAIIKKDGEVTSADTPSTGASKVSSLTGRASPMPSNGRSGKMVTVNVRGANGEHVTAAEMAKRKEIELYANAHPTGLFNLLEGAEIMMQFEDDTRRLLEFDPLIARTKLYRASRTEGLPKLIERIKEEERKKREANLGMVQAVEAEPIASN